MLDPIGEGDSKEGRGRVELSDRGWLFPAHPPPVTLLGGEELPRTGKPPLWKFGICLCLIDCLFYCVCLFPSCTFSLNHQTQPTLPMATLTVRSVRTAVGAEAVVSPLASAGAGVRPPRPPLTQGVGPSLCSGSQEQI